MSTALTTRDREMLDGMHGEGARLAMSILVRMAEVYGADELMDITQVHIDGCGLLSEAGLEFAETLAAAGGAVSVPTTLNMGPLDLQNWREFGVPEDFAEKLLLEEKVAAVPGSAFGKCGEGYVRCCYATSLSEIEEALSRMKRFVTKHQKV